MASPDVTDGFMVRAKVCVVEADAVSVTRRVTFAVPAVVGVPEIVPELDRVSPEGREPETTDHVYDGLPPVALRVWEYVVPTVPGTSGEVVVMARLIDLASLSRWLILAVWTEPELPGKK